MNSERLREILELNNFRKMQQALQAEGFADTKTDKRFAELPLTDVVAANCVAKIEYTESGKYIYIGRLCLGVKDFEQMTFVWIEQLKAYRSVYIPHKILIVAK